MIVGSVLNMPHQGYNDDQAIVGVSITCKDPISNQTSRLVVSERLPNHQLQWEKDVLSSGYVIESELNSTQTSMVMMQLESTASDSR